jgi:RNA polymerase sigma factor (sigma-70 family)
MARHCNSSHFWLIRLLIEWVICHMNSPRPPKSTSQQGDLQEVVAAAVAGDQGAWNDLVQRFTPLVLTVVRRYRLSDSDAEDVRQELWLTLLKHLKDLKEPRALPGWIITCTKNNALRVLASQRRIELVDPQVGSRFDSVDGLAVDDELLRQERRQAVRTALGELRPDHQRLLLLVFADTKISYQQISLGLGIPAGSIGPTRARCLAKLRDTSAVQALAS